MEYTTKRMDEIKPYPNNPRINDEAVADVAESIKQCTYIAPIVIDEEGVILAGHTRYKALRELGYEECKVIVAKGLSDQQKKKYRLFDNKTAEFSKWDFGLLEGELEGIDFQGYDFGQPKKEKEDDGKEKVVCPCCGEEFSV